MQRQVNTHTTRLKADWGSFVRDWFYLWRSLLLIAGLIAVISGGVFAAHTYGKLVRENNARIAEYESLTPYFSNYLFLYDFDSISSLSMAVFGDEKVQSVRVTDRRGFVVFKTEREVQADTIKEFSAPLVVKDDATNVLGNLNISYAIASPWKMVATALNVAIVALVLAFIGSCALITFFVRRYVMAPIHDLTYAVERTVHTGEPVKAAFGRASPFQHFVHTFNHMQERLEKVQTGLSKSLEEVQHGRKLNAELGNVLQKVLAAIGQNVSHFSADGEIRAHDIGRPGGSIFKDLTPPFPNTAEGLKDALLSCANDAASKSRLEIKILNSSEYPNIIFEMEVQDGIETVHSIRCIDLGDDTSAVITTDISEARMLEKTLRQKHKLEALGSLTSGVAHDFNNLLAIISGALEMLQIQNPPKSPEQSSEHHFLNQISYATERATALVNGLLVYSHQKPITLATVQIQDVFTRLVEILPATLGPAIHLEKQMTHNAYVSVDEGLLENALLNLIVNARDAMEGAGTLGLNAKRATPQQVKAFKLDPDKTYSMIEITDTGTGIPADLLHRITDPFFTSKEIGKGTGLGLSTVVGFAGQMGGKLHFENRPEGGAKFSMVLPEIAAPKPVAAPAAPIQSKGNHVLPGRILIVDDEEALCNIWALAARKAGIVVDTAICSREAKAAYFAKDTPGYDVVVTDLNMPDGNGLDLAKEIRAYDPAVTIIATSGNAGLMANEDEFQDYFDGIYTKPIKLGKLVDIIAMHWQTKCATAGALARAIQN